MTTLIDALRANLPARPFAEDTQQAFSSTYDRMWENALHEARHKGGKIEGRNFYDKNGNQLVLFEENENGFVEEVFDEKGNHGKIEREYDENGRAILKRGSGYDSKNNIYYEYYDTNGNTSFDEVNIYRLEEGMTEADFAQVEPESYKKSVDENFQEYDLKKEDTPCGDTSHYLPYDTITGEVQSSLGHDIIKFISNLFK